MGIWLLIVIAVAVVAYRSGVRSGVARGLEQGWRREDRALVDRLSRGPGLDPTDQGPSRGE